MPTRTPARRADDGAAALEFALVMPFLIVLVFGVISFGMIFGQQLALGNAAREASRFGVVDGRTCLQLKNVARDAANTIGMSGANVSVSIKRGANASAASNACPTDATLPCKGSTNGDALFVTLDFSSKIEIPLVVSKSIGLQSNGVFRCEFS